MRGHGQEQPPQGALGATSQAQGWTCPLGTPSNNGKGGESPAQPVGPMVSSGCVPARASVPGWGCPLRPTLLTPLPFTPSYIGSPLVGPAGNPAPRVPPFLRVRPCGGGGEPPCTPGPSAKRLTRSGSSHRRAQLLPAGMTCPG